MTSGELSVGPEVIHRPKNVPRSREDPRAIALSIVHVYTCAIGVSATPGGGGRGGGRRHGAERVEGFPCSLRSANARPFARDRSSLFHADTLTRDLPF